MTATSHHWYNRPHFVAVIIPTLNRYGYLVDVLHDLEGQDYPNFEVLVVDQSAPYDPGFYESFRLKLKVIRQEKVTLDGPKPGSSGNRKCIPAFLMMIPRLA